MSRIGYLEMRLEKLEGQMLNKWDVAMVVGIMIEGIIFLGGTTVAFLRYINRKL